MRRWRNDSGVGGGGECGRGAGLGGVQAAVFAATVEAVNFEGPEQLLHMYHMISICIPQLHKTWRHYWKKESGLLNLGRSRLLPGLEL